jgi:hypothetical protein
LSRETSRWGKTGLVAALRGESEGMRLSLQRGPDWESGGGTLNAGPEPWEKIRARLVLERTGRDRSTAQLFSRCENNCFAPDDKTLKARNLDEFSVLRRGALPGGRGGWRRRYDPGPISGCRENDENGRPGLRCQRGRRRRASRHRGVVRRCLD